MRRELNTARLLLRAPRPGDAQAVFAGWAQDIEALRYLSWPIHTRIEQTQALISWDQARWVKRSAYTWMLLPRPRCGLAEAPIGMIQLIPQQLDGQVHHWRLGYVLARSHWGQGLMREAVLAVADITWARADAQRLDALCDADNQASLRLLTHCGFTREGILRHHTVYPNHSKAARDVVVMARFRSCPFASPASGEPDPGLSASSCEPDVLPLE